MNILQNSHVRHLIKSISWRTVGTIDTMMVAWFVTGNPIMGLKIGGVEVFTKIFLYYLHERLWFKINIGLDRPKNISNDIQWEPNPATAQVQVAFLQHEEKGIRKRVKVTRCGENYTALLSSYNRDTKERFSDILSGTKEQIEKQLNIQLDGKQ
jgi:uncharacterized membrane protein